jgi:hypothetical protein
MTKANTKPAAPETAPTTDNKPALEAKTDLTKPAIKDAIAKGLSIIKEGKTKADAARAMYDTIKAEPKEVIVAAFVQGATLTEKGALTYWYNCKRKAAKTAAKSA